MLKSNFRFRLINRWRFLLCWSWPTNCLTLFCVLRVTLTFAFFTFLSTESRNCHLLKLFSGNLNCRKDYSYRKQRGKQFINLWWKKLCWMKMELLIFAFFFSTKIRFKKRKWKSHKSQRRWRKSVPFNKQTTTEQEDLSFTNRCWFFTINLRTL